MTLRVINGGSSTGTGAQPPPEPRVLVAASLDPRIDSIEAARVALMPMTLRRIDSQDPIDATLPRVAREVMRVCEDPEASPAALARLLARDPALATQAVALANSAYYRGRFGPVEDVSDAVLRLGAAGLRNSILAPRIRARLVNDPISQDLWVHSMSVAAVTPFVAALAKIETEAAYLAGLVHDLGRILLWLDARSLREQYQPLTLRAAVDELHEVVGQALLERWAMPESVMLAVGCHHSPPFVPTTDADRIAHAVCIADQMVGAADREEPLDLEHVTSRIALGIQVRHLETLGGRLPEIVGGATL